MIILSVKQESGGKGLAICSRHECIVNISFVPDLRLEQGLSISSLDQILLGILLCKPSPLDHVRCNTEQFSYGSTAGRGCAVHPGLKELKSPDRKHIELDGNDVIISGKQCCMGIWRKGRGDIKNDIIVFVTDILQKLQEHLFVLSDIQLPHAQMGRKKVQCIDNLSDTFHRFLTVLLRCVEQLVNRHLDHPPSTLKCAEDTPDVLP